MTEDNKVSHKKHMFDNEGDCIWKGCEIKRNKKKTTELDLWIQTLYNDEMTKIYILEYEFVQGVGYRYFRYVVNPLDAIKWAEERMICQDPKLEIKGDWTVEEVELH